MIKNKIGRYPDLWSTFSIAFPFAKQWLVIKNSQIQWRYRDGFKPFFPIKSTLKSTYQFLTIQFLFIALPIEI